MTGIEPWAEDKVRRDITYALEQFAEHGHVPPHLTCATIPAWIYDALETNGSEWFITLRDAGRVRRNEYCP